MKPIAFFIVFLFFIGQNYAQFLPKGQYFEAGFNIGKIYKHSPKIVIPLSELPPVLGAEFSWEQRCYGKKYWHSLSRFPRLGFIGNFQHFRDSRLGWGLGVMPFVSTRFFKAGPVEMFGRMAMGLAYVSERWDGYFNPQNNIIGSHWNSNVAFRIGFGIDVLKKIELRPSFSFTHYSNGASQYPNLGINVMSFHLGILYKNNPIAPVDIIRNFADLPSRHKGPRFAVFTGLGMKEIGRTYRGPKYAILINSIEAGLFASRTNVLKFGLTHEYHQSEYDFYMHSSGAANRADAIQRANKYLFYIEDEILMGHISLVGQIGYYFNNAPVKLPFTRIGFRYYPLDPVKNRLAPYIGIRLKAHAITAEYFDLTIGVAIK